jgi:molybdate transport system permease protein
MSDISALWLTAKLALVTSVVLLLLSIPLAWWLSRPTSSSMITYLKHTIEALIALPLVLPPSVLGFYLLMAFSPNAFLGKTWQGLTGKPLVFSFSGLVIGSLVYSLPFVMQPLQATFSNISPRLLEIGATLGNTPWMTIRRIIFPLSRLGLISAFSLGFAHTIGEFGIVLMIGGNIPNETRVLSIAIYDHVETLNFDKAHELSLILLGFSLLLLFYLYSIKNNRIRLLPC